MRAVSKHHPSQGPYRLWVQMKVVVNKEGGSGDVQAITLDDGNIYAVGHDPLAVIEKGIFRQRLKSLTPYSNWTLIAYGSMSSIAIHTTSSGKVMYGVGSNKLYQPPLATLSIDNVWTEASSFKLSTIAIEGDIIYGLSPSHPG